ncbi:hypothetical protein HDU92_009096 [Lobulomyces angularis]|nr:hypothetical protein HDU92_009096 [Lobulomyces angularis]
MIPSTSFFLFFLFLINSSYSESSICKNDKSLTVVGDSNSFIFLEGYTLNSFNQYTFIRKFNTRKENSCKCLEHCKENKSACDWVEVTSEGCLIYKLKKNENQSTVFKADPNTVLDGKLLSILPIEKSFINLNLDQCIGSCIATSTCEVISFTSNNTCLLQKFAPSLNGNIGILLGNNLTAPLPYMPKSLTQPNATSNNSASNSSLPSNSIFSVDVTDKFFILTASKTKKPPRFNFDSLQYLRYRVEGERRYQRNRNSDTSLHRFISRIGTTTSNRIHNEMNLSTANRPYTYPGRFIEGPETPSTKAESKVSVPTVALPVDATEEYEFNNLGNNASVSVGNKKNGVDNSNLFISEISSTGSSEETDYQREVSDIESFKNTFPNGTNNDTGELKRPGNTLNKDSGELFRKRTFNSIGSIQNSQSESILVQNKSLNINKSISDHNSNNVVRPSINELVFALPSPPGNSISKRNEIQHNQTPYWNNNAEIQVNGRSSFSTENSAHSFRSRSSASEFSKKNSGLFANNMNLFYENMSPDSKRTQDRD